MSSYLALKFIHIVSAILLAGFGFGSLVYFVVGYKSQSLEVMRRIFPAVDALDVWITTPSGISQLVSGVGMILVAGYDVSQAWITWAMVLFFGVGALWLRVVWLQKQMAKLVAQAANLEGQNGVRLKQLFTEWMAHGVIGFLGMISILALMVFKIQ